MRRTTNLLALSAITMLFIGCERQQEDTETTQSALEAVASTTMVMPLTTASDAARNHFMQGQQAMDMGRPIVANAHFEQAVAADPGFAFGYLQVANTATSLDEFKANLELAEQHALSATEAEQLLIQITRQGFENDTEDQLAQAKRLVEIQPSSPRAWLELANVQSSMNRNAEARTSMQKAIELAPQLVVAHTDLGNSYLFLEPRDFVQAEAHFQHAVELAPNEQAMHDFLGDAYRAQGKLEQAAAEYTRAHELDPNNALPLQQRGHVNSFLGSFEAARADYDSAISLGKANEKASYGVYRALVNVYAGNPQAAIDELTQLTASIEQMDIPEPRGQKVFALTTAATIAIHTGKHDQAERLLSQRKGLMMEQADRVATDEFRRGQQANITYLDAVLAAKKGEYAKARQLSDSLAKLVEPDNNPRKMEPVHELLGIIDLYQEKYKDAIGHLRQGNTDDLRIKYSLAQAEEGAGNTAEAKKLYGEVATTNFNDVNFALLRKDATQKAG